MKNMLINANQKEELRVALVEDKYLYDLDIEKLGIYPTKSNIYKAVISKVALSLDAVFVDLGEDKHGFLPIKEISRDSLIGVSPDNKKPILDLLKEGEEILVQITRPSRGNKGAALTTFISLAGSYIVLMVNNPKASGISRRIEGIERQALKELSYHINPPENMGVIIRTAGVSKSQEEINWDLESLINYWKAIIDAAKITPAPCLIHQEGNIVSRVVRDYLVRDINSIIVDDKLTFESLKKWIHWFKPEFIEKLKLYQGKVGIFAHYEIEDQIENAFDRAVMLPSGGTLIFDRAEALTAIDVNSAKSNKYTNIEETAFRTNLEAAKEIARQLRIRDLGGLVVIDFIDMKEEFNQVHIEDYMKKCLKDDRARIQASSISKFGLMEISRQRLRLSLEESNSEKCPRCMGRGVIRDNISTALSIVRKISSVRNLKNNEILCILIPLHVAMFLENEKKTYIQSLEQQIGNRIIIIPNPGYFIPKFSIFSISKKDYNKFIMLEEVDNNHIEQACKSLPSYKEILTSDDVDSKKDTEYFYGNDNSSLIDRVGIVSETLCETRASKINNPSWISKFFGWLTSSKKNDEKRKDKITEINRDNINCNISVGSVKNKNSSSKFNIQKEKNEDKQKKEEKLNDSKKQINIKQQNNLKINTKAPDLHAFNVVDNNKVKKKAKKSKVINKKSDKNINSKSSIKKVIDNNEIIIKENQITPINSNIIEHEDKNIDILSTNTAISNEHINENGSSIKNAKNHCVVQETEAISLDNSDKAIENIVIREDRKRKNIEMSHRAFLVTDNNK